MLIRDISFHDENFAAHSQLFQAPVIGRGEPSDETVDFLAFLEQKLT